MKKFVFAAFACAALIGCEKTETAGTVDSTKKVDTITAQLVKADSLKKDTVKVDTSKKDSAKTKVHKHK